MNGMKCWVSVCLTVLGVCRASATSRVDSMSDARRTIKSALEVYRLEFNSYPTTNQGLAVLAESSGAEGRPPYLARVPTDRWGHAFRYRLADGAPRLDSAGPDGKFGTNDDVPDVGPAAVSAAEATITNAPFRQLAIPERGQYEGVHPTVLLSESDLLREGVGGAGDLIRAAGPDFTNEAVVVFPHNEPSGSNRVKFVAPRVEGKRLICRLERQVASIGTADMAYYCYAIAVKKGHIREVELLVEGHEAGILLTIPDEPGQAP